MNKRLPAYVIGVDFGTDSVRSVLVNVHDGAEVGSATFSYPRWRDGLHCAPDRQQFRQHPLDYVEGLEFTIRECVRLAGSVTAAHIKGVSVDTTGSTPVAVDNKGIPLALLPGFENNPNAQFILWKDHTAIREATAINTQAQKFPVNYLQDVGGIYSSEWFWAKLLHILRVDEAVRLHTASWVEHCDWIPFLLTGGSDVRDLKRSVCSAGHKALWSPVFGGYPPNEFFAGLDPLLDGFVQRLPINTFTADQPAGRLSGEWAARLGLSTDVVVGMGAFDAHMGAVGGQIEPHHLSKVMGTSTCDMMVVPVSDMGNKKVRGICGQVEGSVIPGMLGLEAGQSAFGDVYAWFRSVLEWPLKQVLPYTTTVSPADVETASDALLVRLAEEAAQLPPDGPLPLATDWLNGRRTPDANQELKAAITQLQLGTTAPQLFRALAEATCFGARAITDRFAEEGVAVKGIIGLGGVAKKSTFIMQLMADVLQMPIRIHKSEQTCALGAAMFAATAAGFYPNVEEAMQAMGQGFERTYYPSKEKKEIVEKRYQQYRELGEWTEKQMKNVLWK